MPKKKQQKKVSDVDLPLPDSFEQAETRRQIRERKGLSINGVAEFLLDLDSQGILKSQRIICRAAGGMKGTTVVYWIEI